jgi:tRNA(Ile)-lysidine synthase
MPPEKGSTAAGDRPVPGKLPEAELTARFLSALFGLWTEAERDESLRLGLAVSGGPDSCALLLLAASGLPGRVEAASVDHRLRPESAAEAAEVARLCERLGVPHRILEVDVASGNVQSEARIARYAALAGWVVERGLAALATAHHADDQAETLLLRLNRASGVAGLAGTRARGKVPETDIALLRPLLDWRRAELAGIVETAAISAAHDPSNLDDRYDRVRLRKALGSADWLDIAAISQSASHLADADAALDWAARREWAERVEPEAFGMKYNPRAPRAIALRVIARIVRELEGEEPRGGAIARLLDTLAAGQSGSIGNLVARPDVGGWSFTKAPRRREKKE